MSLFTFKRLVIEWDTIRLVLEEVELLTQNIYDVSKLHILEKSLTVWLVLIGLVLLRA